LIADLKNRAKDFIKKIAGLEQRLEQYEGKSVTDTMRYFEAKQKAPRRMAEIIADIMRSPPEKLEHEKTEPERKRNQGLDV